MDDRELKQLREKIDAIDGQLLDLFVARQRTAGEIGAYKASKGLPLHDPAREAEVIGRVRAAAGEEEADAAQALFDTLFRLSRERQARILETSRKL